MILLVLLAFLVGLLIGSFLNVVVYRVPRHESVAFPASHCPTCNHPIRYYDNVPVVSWLMLRGRCRDCGAKISARYPLVEALTGASFGLVALWFLVLRMPHQSSVAGGFIELAAFLYLAAISIALAIIDIEVFRLPNAIVLPSYIVGAAVLGTAALVEGDLESLARAILGAAALFVLYLLMVLVYPTGMGLGDVKLAGVLGLFLAWLGWGELAVGAFSAFLLGGIFSVVLLIARRAGRKSRIPFGPWMLAGAWVGVVVGGPVAAAYLSLFGLA